MKTVRSIVACMALCFFFPRFVQAQSISGVVNAYYAVTAVNVPTNTITLNNAAGLSTGIKVLLIQMKGASMDATNAASFGNITAINDAGNYEFNYVCSISGNNVVLQYSLLRTYDPTSHLQLVTVPVYGSVTVTDTLWGTAWDSLTGSGGVLALEATDTLFVNSAVDVNGQGFQGGPLMNFLVPPYNCSWAVNVTDYFLSVPPSDMFHTGGKKGEGIAEYITGKEWGRGKLASGGGGGNNNNTGGAGGSNYGSGGNGGQRTHESGFSCHGTNPGIGGAALSGFGYSLGQNRIFPGSGGGSGHENNSVGLPGGNGGGIIILTAPVIQGTGATLLANGLSPENPTNLNPWVAEGDGGGGGGAGGTIILNSPAILGTISAQAQGARGSDASNNVTDCTGPGGGGGGGVVWIAGASFPPALTSGVSGGGNGVVSANSGDVACRGSANGATSGLNGSYQSGYIAPMGVSSVCAILPASDLAYFTGTLNPSGATLRWGMYETGDIQAYLLERSADQRSYQLLDSVQNQGEKQWTYTDPQNLEGTRYYRLKLLFRNGTSAYSRIVPLSRNIKRTLELTRIQPNPAVDLVQVHLYAGNSGTLKISVFNVLGQRLFRYEGKMESGNTVFNLPVSGLTPGTYLLCIEENETRCMGRFMKTE
jgi:hypothetical protein